MRPRVLGCVVNDGLRARLVRAGRAANAVHHLLPARVRYSPEWDELLAALLVSPPDPRWGNVDDFGDVVWAADFAEAERVRDRTGMPIVMDQPRLHGVGASTRPGIRWTAGETGALARLWPEGR